MTAEPTKAHVKPARYVVVFVILAVVTGLEFFIGSFIGQPGNEGVHTLGVVALVVLSLLKAALVMMFFMHLKYDSKYYSLLLLFPLFMAVLLTVIVLIAANYNPIV